MNNANFCQEKTLNIDAEMKAETSEYGYFP